MESIAKPDKLYLNRSGAMSIDVKMNARPGEIHIRSLSNGRGQYGVSFLYCTTTHQETQAMRARLGDAAVGPVMPPSVAFGVGARMMWGAILCTWNRLFKR